ncbi:MAG: GHMP kinase [Lentisphaeria bacterium]|jgi:glucuronokinase|nr:GHMP kinase [Lentisphaeria bacterium]
MLFRTRSYARAGLLGNPSDGYYGKTIAFSIEDFPVDVTIYESPELRIEPGDVDQDHFASLSDLVNTVQHYGYYGGIRLIKATIKVFAHYCQETGIELPDRNFTIRYFSTVPRLVGLGGSSAICTATFKALMKFYEVRDIPFQLIPTLCWRAESEELGIQCGMQDRVIQVYEGMVFMDFEEQHFLAQNHGHYEWLDTASLPRVYLAYDPNRAEFSGIYHRKLRVLFEEQKKEIVAAMSEFADIAQRGRDAIVAGQTAALPELINANFDLRNRVFKVAAENARMVEYARKAGASAKFAGSGGAIVGTYDDERMYQRLIRELHEIGCTVLRPCIAPPQDPARFPA